MTRDKLKSMVIQIMDEDVCTHNLTSKAIHDLAEKIMKLWDQGFAYVINTRLPD